jgi:asparagine synthase (glutamine-hydrolysing)
LDAGVLRKLTDAMSFRGPDACGNWIGDYVGLGHSLLRTTAESASETQPWSVDGDVVIAADARVDRRAALRQQLRAAGRPLDADTPDVELILHSYLAWGDGCLQRLIGDFAFVIWDARRQRVLAARDQFGVAQLFYTQTADTLLVGNTLHSLLCHPNVSPELDQRTIADAALFGVYLDDDATGYAAIRRVPAGHKLLYDDDVARIERYWSPDDPRPSIRYRRGEDYAEHFALLFDEAVADRLRTDSVGSQLSGGMDSTSVTVTAHRRLRARRRPFSFRAYVVDYGSLISDEEGVLAAEVARHAGIQLDILAGEAFMGTGPPVDPRWVPPEPGALTLFAMEEICRRTIAFARVLLTGYGGDPLLHPPYLTWRRALAAARAGSWRWPAQRLLARRRQAKMARAARLPAWVDRSWAAQAGLVERLAQFYRQALREQVGMFEAPLWRALFAFSDAGYSGLPLSIRFPFFDLRLVEFVRAIPPTPWLEDKVLLRDAMRQHLPEAVRKRAKTVMRGNVNLERNKRSGVPTWEIDVLATPSITPYVDQDWLRRARALPAADRAETWARERPPVQLGYWLHQREEAGDSAIK